MNQLIKVELDEHQEAINHFQHLMEHAAQLAQRVEQQEEKINRQRNAIYSMGIVLVGFAGLLASLLFR